MGDADCDLPTASGSGGLSPALTQINAIHVTRMGPRLLGRESTCSPLASPTFRRIHRSDSPDVSFSVHKGKEKVHTLELLNQVEPSALYKTFEARVAGHHVIAKFAVMNCYPNKGDEDWPDGCDGHSIETALEALQVEEVAYAFLERLPEDARRFAPRNYGLFRFSASVRQRMGSKPRLFDPKAERKAIYCRIEECVGRDLTLAEQDLPETMEQLGKMYMTLHKAGIIHGDADWRHVKLRGDSSLPPEREVGPPYDPNKLVIIDWKQAIIRSAINELHWDVCTDCELRAVARFNRGDPRHPENLKRWQWEEDVLRRHRYRQLGDSHPSSPRAVDNTLPDDSSDSKPVPGCLKLPVLKQVAAFQVVPSGSGIHFCPLDRTPPIHEPLYRVCRTTSSDSVAFSLHTSKSEVHTLLLFHMIDSGALYTAFTASLGGHFVVVKFAMLESFPLNDSERPRGYDGHTVETALRALKAEEAAYARLQENLPEHARKYVPRNYGLFRFSNRRISDSSLFDVEPERDSVYCRIEEYAGRKLSEIELRQPSTMEQLGKMYMAIHAAGVVHEDIDWRHIVLRGESKASANVLDPSFDPENLALIDWNMSHVRTTQSDADWQRITESELYAVATLPRGDPEDMNLSKFEEEVLRRYAIAYPDDDDDDRFSDEEVETVDDNLASKDSYDIAERLSESELNPAVMATSVSPLALTRGPSRRL